MANLAPARRVYYKRRLQQALKNYKGNFTPIQNSIIGYVDTYKPGPKPHRPRTLPYSMTPGNLPTIQEKLKARLNAYNSNPINRNLTSVQQAVINYLGEASPQRTTQPPGGATGANGNRRTGGNGRATGATENAQPRPEAGGQPKPNYGRFFGRIFGRRRPGTNGATGNGRTAQPPGGPAQPPGGPAQPPGGANGNGRTGGANGATGNGRTAQPPGGANGATGNKNWKNNLIPPNPSYNQIRNLARQWLGVSMPNSNNRTKHILRLLHPDKHQSGKQKEIADKLFKAFQTYLNKNPKERNTHPPTSSTGPAPSPKNQRVLALPAPPTGNNGNNNQRRLNAIRGGLGQNPAKKVNQRAQLAKIHAQIINSASPNALRNLRRQVNNGNFTNEQKQRVRNRINKLLGVAVSGTRIKTPVGVSRSEGLLKTAENAAAETIQRAQRGKIVRNTVRKIKNATSINILSEINRGLNVSTLLNQNKTSLKEVIQRKKKMIENQLKAAANAKTAANKAAANKAAANKAAANKAAAEKAAANKAAANKAAANKAAANKAAANKAAANKAAAEKAAANKAAANKAAAEKAAAEKAAAEKAAAEKAAAEKAAAEKAAANKAAAENAARRAAAAENAARKRAEKNALNAYIRKRGEVPGLQFETQNSLNKWKNQLQTRFNLLSPQNKRNRGEAHRGALRTAKIRQSVTTRNTIQSIQEEIGQIEKRLRINPANRTMEARLANAQRRLAEKQKK